MDLFGWDPPPPVTNGIGGDPPSDGETIPNTLEAVIITASKGGGRAVTVTYGFYEDNVHPDATLSDFTNYVSFAQADAESFANSHLHGDQNTQAYQRAKEVLLSLYALAKLNVAAGIQGNFDGPNGHTLTWSELLQGLNSTQVYVGPFQAWTGQDFNAFTDVRTEVSKIYLDDAKMTSYVDAFGIEKAYNFAIYHEFSHASVDGRADANNPNREAITNEYGQMLAEINGASYPTDTELSQVGGTVPR